MITLRLRPHQIEAQTAIAAHFAAGGQRGLIKAFCGAGKSLMMTDSIVCHGGALISVFVPSLSLVSQYVQDYVAKYLAGDYEYLVVCSLAELEDPNTPKEYKTKKSKVTTEPAAITKFLTKKTQKKGKIVLCTYQSLHLLSPLAPLGITFTLACFDEAHVATAQTYKKLIFGTPSLFVKALFFTATPINRNGIYMFNPDGDTHYQLGGENYEIQPCDGIDEPEEKEAEEKEESPVDVTPSDGESDEDDDDDDDEENSNYEFDEENDSNYEEEEESEYSAENPHCGPLLFEYSHSRGVAEGILSDFQIRIDLHSDRDRDRDRDNTTILFIFESMVRAMFATGNFHALTFHSRVNGTDTDVSTFASKENKELFKKVVPRLLRQEFPHLVEKYKDIHKKIRFEAFSCSTKPAQRQKVLHDLGAAGLDDIFVLASQNTIGVGVDTKNANMVVFIDPKQSYVQIVQNVGRVCRPQPEGRPPTTVLLPLCVSAAQYQAVAGDVVARDRLLRENMTRPDGDFTMILNVLSALRQADPHVFQLCLEYPHTFAPSELQAHFARHNVGLEAGNAMPVEELFAQHDVVYDPAVSEEANFTALSHAQEGNIQVTHAALTADTMDIDSGYDTVAHYVKTPDETFVAGKTRTAAFLAKPRRQNVRPFVHCSPDMQVLWGITSDDMEGRDVGVYGAYIEATVIVDRDEDWLGKFERVESYAKEHGHLPKYGSKDSIIQKMTNWMVVQNAALKNPLKNPGAIINKNAEFWEKWDKLMAEYANNPEEDWLANFEQLEGFAKETGHLPIQGDSKKMASWIQGDSKKMASWMNNQKQNIKKKYPRAAINKHADLRAKWDKLMANYAKNREEDWLAIFKQVEAYKKTNGYLPKRSSKNPAHVNKIAGWLKTNIKNTKYNYPKSVVNTNSEFRAKWDKLMTDNNTTPEKRWLVSYENVKTYAKKHNGLPIYNDKDPDIKIMTNWMVVQKRALKNPLKNPGAIINTNADFRAKWDKLTADFAKNPDEDWVANFEQVEIYTKTHRQLPNKRDKDMFVKKLGIWVSQQKKSVKNPGSIINKNPEIRAKWDAFVMEYQRHFTAEYLEKHAAAAASVATTSPTRKRTLSSTASDVADEEMEVYDDVSEAAVAEPPAEPPAKKQKRSVKKAPLAIAAAVAAPEEIAPEEPAPAENSRKRKRPLSELSEYHREFNGKASARTQAHFQADPADWHHYHTLLHASYDEYENPQAAVPVLRLIDRFEQKQRRAGQKKVVVDMGCGLAEIGTHFRDSARYDVISIDYVAADPASTVTTVVGNMRDTGLPDGSANYVVFSLSLMGTQEDVEAYLLEARRLLDAQGEVIVVEPRDSGRWRLGEGGEACGKLRALLERHFVIKETKGNDERFLYFFCAHKEEEEEEMEEY